MSRFVRRFWTSIVVTALCVGAAGCGEVSFVAPDQMAVDPFLDVEDPCGELGCVEPPPDDDPCPNGCPGLVNLPPIVSAGADQTVLGGALVTLQGSAIDPDEGLFPGSALSHTWTQTAGPTVTLSNPGALDPTFIAPLVSTATILTFRLTATDTFEEEVDLVSITVSPAGVPEDLIAGIDLLIAKVNNATMDKNTAKSLLSLLKNARSAAQNGTWLGVHDMLRSFVAQVEALSGKKMTQETAGQLVSVAQVLIAELAAFIS